MKWRCSEKVGKKVLSIPLASATTLSILQLGPHLVMVGRKEAQV